MNERIIDLEEQVLQLASMILCTEVFQIYCHVMGYMMMPQIRDIKIFLEAQKTIDKMSDSNGIKEGTVLPVAYEQSSPGHSKRNKKSGRRRN